MPSRALALAALVLALVHSGACVSAPPARAPAVAIEATEAVFAGQAAMLARPERAGEARLALERAAILAPGWVAPLRLLDELDRVHLRGVIVLREHRAALARDPRDARRLYLAGRLEGKEGRKRFEDAVRFDPDLAWGWHGLSHAAAAEGRGQEAVALAQGALERAIDPWERTFFQTTLARQLAANGDHAGAMAFLEESAAEKGATERQRTQLLVVFVEIGLDSMSARTRERAYEKGLEIVREREVTDTELESLVTRMRRSLYIDDLDGSQLGLALACIASPTRERLRAEPQQNTPLGRAVMQRAYAREGRAAPAGSRTRASRFGTGDFAGAVESWRASLPRAVLAPDGMPRSEKLADVVRLARGISADSPPAALVELGDALVRAGWFREARHVAAKLALADVDAALALDLRATAGQTIIDGIMRIASRSDLKQQTGPGADREKSDASRPVGTLAQFLEAMAPFFARANRFLGGDTDIASVAKSLRDSPRMEYIGLAELVHPGPRFSAGDERDELGKEGELVGGLAPLFARIGRFALVGQVVGGGGADVCVLPVVLEERLSGEHLGVKWQGSVAWCESADIKGRAGRRGALISAAALHEGYWVDIDAVREELAGWNALRRYFSDSAGVHVAERQEILASTGLVLDERASEFERRSTTALLGEANRVRLAVLSERPLPSGELGELTLEEMLEVTSIHEQGHLCDRTRYLPLFDHKLAILRLLVQCHFSPQRVSEELEYRAQLTALCESPDPRIALAQVLDAAEGATASSLTPHSAGYKRLFDDFLRVLDEALASDPNGFRAIDRTLTIAHQCHRLDKEAVRRVSRMLAGKKGM